MISSPTKIAGFFAGWASSMRVVDWLVEEDRLLFTGTSSAQSLPCPQCVTTQAADLPFVPRRSCFPLDTTEVNSQQLLYRNTG